MHLRLIAPDDVSGSLRDRLVDDPCVTNVVFLPGTALSPAGDVLHCDVTREAVADVLDLVRGAGLYERGAVALSTVDAAPSANAARTERSAPGAPDDALVWDQVLDQANGEVRGSWSYYVFLTLATLIASVAVITDSSVLVVGAMVVGPEFAAVSALALGVVLLDLRLSGRALRLLVQGFAVAVLVAAALALLGRVTGVITLEDVTGPRPLTGFIWRPDLWSAVVALLAGTAGVLSQTAGKTNALVGVFISVTTVPAAGDLALSLAFGQPTQLAGSAAQLGINLVGMLVAGVLTLLVQRALWATVRKRRRAAQRGATGTG
ncbi:DUF389 domain-containing protein [Microlunatus kandeliicorticis]|nr:DUF389 domain-containing protein [Microlunatus kandeliicorticis]